VRGSGVVVCSLSLLIRWAQRARCQAETPLIVLCRFPQPAQTLGLKQAGFQVISAVELDAGAVATYRNNHPDVLVKHEDIRRLSPLALKRTLGLRAGELDLLAGCPPCQGFSTLRTLNGAKDNADRRNRLIYQMLRFARAFRPKAVMMENVPTLLQQKSFRRLCRGLERLGYKLTVGVKNAANYGVPQRRRRLILLAGRDTEIPFARESRRLRTVGGAIRRMPVVGRSKDPLHNMPEKKRSAKIAKLIRDIPKNGGSRTDLPKTRQLPCHRKSDGFHDIYGRMSWSDVAPTITSGCFNPSKGRFLHPELDRNITMREAAILQGFPRTYFFDVSLGKEAIALLVGNALPPEFIRRNALSIRGVITRRTSAS
jgi:DNA (cytosine-5)-methyltransferase 1